MVRIRGSRVRTISVLLCTAGALAAACAPGTAYAGAAPAFTAGSRQWPLDAGHFDAQRIWALSTGSGVTVAVVDTGVDAASPDLRGQVLPGVDLTDEAANGQVDTSSDSHGTSVAGVIAGNGDSGGAGRMTGLAPGAKILPIRIADSSDDVNPTLAAEGISYAVTHGARIINLSLGTAVDDPEIRGAVGYALAHGIIVIAADGNNGLSGNQPEYPAAIPGVLAVAGSTQAGGVWTQGESGSYVDLAAPAEDVYSTSDTGGHMTSAGTSYSAPFVSAAAALLWARYPSETAGQIIARLIDDTDPIGGTHGRTDQSGFGELDPYKALTAPAPAKTTNPLLAESAKPTAATGGGGLGLAIPLSGAGGALIVAGGITFWWWKRRKKSAPKATVVTSRPKEARR
jgi:type VII secretion-associated serine protease mycosin